MSFELAQVNIAKLLAPLDSPQLYDFVANLDRINALAEASPGFVWRLKDEAGNATAIRPFGDDVIVNMSVWRDIDALFHYAYATAHTEVLKRRQEWFHQFRGAYMALWWVPAGHRPTLEDAKARLDHREANGDTAYAFSFKRRFTPEGLELQRVQA